jgi:hypothetical protein
MNLSGWQKQKIGILADYQDMLSFLYTLYSEKFPAYQDFWLNLALPKLRYADWLRSCTQKIIDSVYNYNMMRFTNETILTGLDYLQMLVRNARSEKFTQGEAVALAFVIESGMIASKFYEIVDSKSNDELSIIVAEFKTEKIEKLRLLKDFNSFNRVSNQRISA